MNEKIDRPENRLSLHALKPRARAIDPFSRNMAAIVQAGVDETESLEQQAIAKPAKASKPKAKVERPTTDGETARLHTRIPISQMIELQVHCARNRITMQDVVLRLITEFLAKQAQSARSCENGHRAERTPGK